MDDPIKIIFKFKNNGRRTQHHMYIFVGEIPSNIMSILNKIKTKSLYDALTTLEKSDISKLEKKYGDDWFKKFYNTHHLNFTIHNIRKTSSQQKELKSKLGDNWYKKHIEEHTLIDKKIFYSYEAFIQSERIRKELRKRKVMIREDEDIVNYTTKKKEDISAITTQQIKRPIVNRGGNSGESYEINSIDEFNLSDLSDSDNEQSEISNDDNNSDNFLHGLHNIVDNYNLHTWPLDDQIGGEIEEPQDLDIELGYGHNELETDDGDNVMEFDEGVEPEADLADDDMELEAIEQIYQNMDVIADDNAAQTAELIKKALKDDNIFKKSESKLIEFDQSKDDLMFDEQLKNLYDKHYVTNQYIFKDDTVKMVKNKICCSILNNQKFGKKSFIAPSRQYLWGEYYFNNKIEKIMVGQKWIRKTELLHIDIEPNSNIRYYEELRGNLKLLRDNIKRYGTKIKREDDDFNILYDYGDYYSNNELFLIDIYNELGKGYKPDEEIQRNISDVYVRLYFPKIGQDDIKYIFNYLNDDKTVEENKLSTIYETINNDLVLENQIMKNVEDVKKTSVYTEIFKDNYITQSVIHVDLRYDKNNKIDLFRIFNEFITTNKYPFIQYQTQDGQIIFKYNETHIMEYSKKKENVDVLSKWFENAPYGISFKVRIMERNTEKFMAINLNDNGRIEYKTQWKEEDMATVKDIRNTYNYVKDLVNKVNGEKNKIKFDIPMDHEFKSAFINTIQRFELPKKFMINHNDLSEFSRYFYPYVALVIEPRKRQSKSKKISEKSKFGTYLRYKRVSKYENQARIEQRILYFMRNYDYNDQSLSSEISKQFNITIDRAMEEIERVRTKYPNIKRSRKILKKLEDIPKYKPPGIGIDIQGKQRDKYKIRISGARDKPQLDRIIMFMNILIYLYVETYLYKYPERQVLKEKLKKLTNIARRRNRVDDIVNYEKATKTVKQMAQLDKKRIGFKPEKGQNQWTRSCQNSGDDKKRRPQQYTSVIDLRKEGFKLNNKTGIYEKKETVKIGKKKTEVILRAVGLGGTDEEGNPLDTVYYSCNPKDNAEHMFVGFLSRSNNPYGQCMPCCFKKDPVISKNKEKKDYFMKCIGKMQKKEKPAPKIIGDRLYILQDTNKIQEGRFGFLPKYLDFFLNQAVGNVRKIKHHYLASTKTGYYFKFGSRQDEYPFLNAIASLLDININDITNSMISALENDKGNMLFTSLNNGDIRTQFISREKFIQYIRSSNMLSFELFNHFISIPGVLIPQGLNMVVFDKQTITIKQALEKEKTRDDFILLCQNNEESDNLRDESRRTLFILKENKNFYPIINVKKADENTKDVKITKLFTYNKTEKNNVVDYVMDYYMRNCEMNIVKIIKGKKNKLIAKKLYGLLHNIKNKEFIPRFQIIDSRNKCKYIVSANYTVIPVKPSGSIYNLQITKNLEGKLQSVRDTIQNLTKLYKLSKEMIPIKPIGVYYDSKTKDKAKIVAIMTELYDTVPVKDEVIPISWIYGQGLIMENKQLFDRIDEELEKGKDNIAADERIMDVNFDNYKSESYELFRLELSEYINNPDNENIKKKLIRIITDKKLSRDDKRGLIRRLLYKLIDKSLLDFYDKEFKPNKQRGGKQQKFIHVANKLPELRNYTINNNRDTCNTNNNKDQCNANPHCRWGYDECLLSLTKELIIEFINRVCEELINDELKAAEILQKEGYFVSDIVDYNRFTERDDQKIIKSTNYSINKMLAELFGKDGIPTIGKRRSYRDGDVDYVQMNIDNPLYEMGDYYTQKIIENNLSIFRAFANGYFWIKQKFYDLDSRNLGYYSKIQTNLANYFRSKIIDWSTNKNNKDMLEKQIVKYMDTGAKKDNISEFIIRVTRDVITSTNCVLELYILNKIYHIPIIVYDDNNEIIYIIDDDVLYDAFNDNKNILEKKHKYKNKNFVINAVNIKFSLLGSSVVPVAIDIIYYK